MSKWKRIALICFSSLVLGLAPLGAAIAQVKVTAATPSSTYQGTVSLDVVVSGSGFDPSAKAQYFVSGTINPGGITVTKVVFRKSTEIVTTIDVAEGAVLANFDIQVMLDSGRKGKGTTLFSVKAKPTGPPAAPAYPPGRFYHAIASNGGTTTQTSRLYMFGGMSTWSSWLGDLWAYANAGSSGGTWTLIPGGTSTPSPRRSFGWSCGAGQCVAANGITSGFIKETWIFSESTQTWSQVNCRRVLCPSFRMGPTMAYDPARGIHVMFGGDGNTTMLADTFTFNTVTKAWKQLSGGTVPQARAVAAATFVPDLGRIVMFGGYTWNSDTPLQDMYSWTGAGWESVGYTNSPIDVPALWNQSMAWDPIGRRLIVTGGFVDSGHTPNTQTWYVTFTNATGAWQATWTLASGIGCQSAAGSPPDPVVHPGALMTYDLAARVQVFFGGELAGGEFSYANTVECR
jgi:Galactose oxidase, central domain